MQTRSGRRADSMDLKEDIRQVPLCSDAVYYDERSRSGSKLGHNSISSKASSQAKAALHIAKIKQRQIELENKLRSSMADNEVELAKLQIKLAEEAEEQDVPDIENEVNLNHMDRFLRDCNATAYMENKENVISNIPFEHRPKLELPKVEISSFDGDPTCYWRFMRQFDFFIERSVSDPGQRLLYLLYYCKGSAKELIQECTMLPPDRGYVQARNILREMYGEPHQIARILIDGLVDNIKSQNSDAESLTKLATRMQNCEMALNQMEQSSDLDSLSTLERIVRKLPLKLQDEWSVIADSIFRNGSNPSFHDLTRLVTDKARIARSRFGQIKRDSEARIHRQPQIIIENKRDDKPKHKFHNAFFFNKPESSVINVTKCPQCTEEHSLEQCPQFIAMDTTKRWELLKTYKRCFICLRHNHRASNCQRKRVCGIDGCTKTHHRLLHSEEIQPQTKDSICTATKVNHGEIYLGIIPVIIKGPLGVIRTYALLDNGSDATLIRADVTTRLGIQTLPTTLNVNTVVTSHAIDSSVCKFQVTSLRDDSEIEVNEAYVVRQLPIQKPVNRSNACLQKWPHLKDVQLDVLEQTEVTLLIGCNVPEAHWVLDQKIGGRGQPYAAQTILGWVIYGPSLCANEAVSVRCTISGEPSVWDELKALYNHEFADTDKQVTSLSVEDNKAIKIATDSLRYNGHQFEIALPWRNLEMRLPNNYQTAYKRLMYLRRRFIKDQELFSKYREVFRRHMIKGYITDVPADQLSKSYYPSWYLPHHPVINPKKPGKLRVVFDCAAKHKGVSLNDYLYQGPDTTANLTGVLLRFRKEIIAVAADIEEMFLQVKVPKCDRGALRLLWWPRDDLNADPIELQLTVHPFGATSSPFCANFALRSASDYCNDDISVTTKQAITSNFYVDDCLISLATTEQALTFVNEVSSMLGKCGFRLRKWVSNERKVLQSIPKEERSCITMELNTNELPVERTLGLEWDAETDVFKFNFKLAEKPMTRRGLLSCASSLFDPLGLVAPLLLPAKCLLQDLCRKNLPWDAHIAKEDQKLWDDWVNGMKRLHEVRIWRCLKPRICTTQAPQLHIFCDASEKGYGAVAYLRYAINPEKYESRIALAKARVSPIKTVTIPRLELTAAVLACRLYCILARELDINFQTTTFWTDSRIVLYYIHNTTSRYSTFVANRLTEIHETTEVANWRHIASNSNPADLASRGILFNIDQLKTWLTGPTFLCEPECSWPVNKIEVHGIETKIEFKKGTVNLIQTQTATEGLHIFFEHFSEWFKLLKSIAWLTRFKTYILAMKGKRQDYMVRVGRLTVEEIESAKCDIIRLVQRSVFAPELLTLTDSLTSNSRIPKRSSLSKLNPILVNGIICVGGRLQQAEYPQEFKHPTILPRNHCVTEMLIRHYHRSEGHSGTSHVLAAIRQSYWIVQGASAVKRIVKGCMICKKRRATLGQQMMAPLPIVRVEKGWCPFSYVGVDYFGPLFVKRNRCIEKRYGCIFMCLQCRAVHFEIAHSLSTDSFIMALMRFISRRGKPFEIYSDNGSNFIGAVGELKSNMSEWSQDRINDTLLVHGIKWHFNPPACSHRGGVWERLIRSVRRIIHSIVHDQVMNDEVLITLLGEAERILNDRPLVPLHSDPDDYSALRPSDLLSVRNTGDIKPNDVIGSLFTKRWKQVNYLTNIFWKRWLREYLPTLQTRQRWLSAKRNFRKGDLVMVAQESTQRGRWPLGVIDECRQEQDGLVRTVIVRTASGMLRRDVRKICLLEGFDEDMNKE